MYYKLGLENIYAVPHNNKHTLGVFINLLEKNNPLKYIQLKQKNIYITDFTTILIIISLYYYHVSTV